MNVAVGTADHNRTNVLTDGNKHYRLLQYTHLHSQPITVVSSLLVVSTWQ